MSPLEHFILAYGLYKQPKNPKKPWEELLDAQGSTNAQGVRVCT